MPELELARAERAGEWLIVPLSDSVPESLAAGSHPHHVRQWLLALAVFPDKWVNRLFSVGGLKLDGGRLWLEAFPKAGLARHEWAAGDAESGGVTADVLFEDDWCLVMNKPAGMAVHPSRPGQRGTLDEAAVRHCLATGQDAPVRHIHRLDDDTSGPVLYAKNDLAQWRLDGAMREKAINRQYLALVNGVPQRPGGTIDAPIGRDRHHGSRRRVSLSGETAITHYETRVAGDDAALVRVTLDTGRTHQIRVHFSHIGHPLLGDTLYGAPAESSLRHQALHGERLIFPHPWTGKDTVVGCPLPGWFAGLSQRHGIVTK
ncbi:RluA family pseudouridine synthase [Paenibacillus darwinianus]|nr:RluA family pseudouridine synthase [Paenibacillus darwinianus]